MLEGVEILNQTEIMVEQSAANPIIRIISIIFILLPIIYYLILAGALFTKKYGNKILKMFRKLGLEICLLLPGIIAIVACMVEGLNKIRIKEVPSGKYIYMK